MMLKISNAISYAIFTVLCFDIGRLNGHFHYIVYILKVQCKIYYNALLSINRNISNLNENTDHSKTSNAI